MWYVHAFLLWRLTYSGIIPGNKPDGATTESTAEGKNKNLVGRFKSLRLCRQKISPQ